MILRQNWAASTTVWIVVGKIRDLGGIELVNGKNRQRGSRMVYEVLPIMPEQRE